MSKKNVHTLIKNTLLLGLPCWSVVKTLPFTAGGTGLIPAQGTKILHDKWLKKKKKNQQNTFLLKNSNHHLSRQ